LNNNQNFSPSQTFNPNQNINNNQNFNQNNFNQAYQPPITIPIQQSQNFFSCQSSNPTKYI